MSTARVEKELIPSRDDEKDGIVKRRFLGFLIWQCLLSISLFVFSKTLLFSQSSSSYSSLLFSLLSFFTFHASLLLFSFSLFLLSSPHPHPAASPLELLLAVPRLLLVPLSDAQPLLTLDFRRRARQALSFVLFVAVCAVSASIEIVSLCWASARSEERGGVIGKLGFQGLLVGLFYGALYVYKRRWVLQFPIIQRPLFFSFKMGLPSAIGQALKSSVAGFSFSTLVMLFLSDWGKSRHATISRLVVEHIILYIGSFSACLSWELSHHLFQVLHSKRVIFAPPKGSAAAETNPSEPLLATLEESVAKSLLQYLAYFDLCLVAESNVDTWRRAALFEESGETYKRAITICLRPMEEFTLKLGAIVENSSADNSLQLSNQLRTPKERVADSRIYDSFNDFQLCAWCARIVSSLTARSHEEDRYGVAQLSGSNAAVISTLLSALLAVESFMGKKTSIQSPNYLMDPSGIRWATLSSGRRDLSAGVAGKRKGSPLYAKAYAMADILKTSIYCIVSAFGDEMLNAAKAGLLEKHWITGSKPLFGSRELLLQKLMLFLDFRAT